MKTKKILFPLTLLCLFSTLISCSGSSSLSKEKCPKYDNELSFSSYAYAPPGSGYYTVDGYDYPGAVDNEGNVISFQTLEKYQEYKDCGFDIIMIQADDAYFGEEFSTSHVKELMDLALEVGLKCIIFDNRIYTLSNKKEPIVGTNCLYKTDEELQNYIASCMKDYSLHEAFYGLLIKDEPTYENLPSIGSLFKAIKAVSPNTFVQCNLYPLSTGAASYYMEGGNANNVITAYKNYLETFLSLTESNYIMADSYPMKIVNGYNKIDPNHIKTTQMLLEAAEKYQAEVHMVAQTSAWSNNGIKKARVCEEQDIYWQTNFYMGMGVKEISYFTYQTKKTNSTGGEYFVDGGSIIKWNGQKTAIYDYVKNAQEEMQNIASAILSFDYQGLKYYKNGTPDISYLGGVNFVDSFIKIDSVTTSVNSVVLISELYDAENDNYMYMVFNPSDPSLNSNAIKVKVNFKEANALAIYDKGELSGEKINKSKSFSLLPGEARFVIPFNV